MKKGLFFNLKGLKAISVILALFMVVFTYQATTFAAETNKDFTLDDGTGDSPQVILRDETGDGELTVQKKDAGEADIINTEGPINLKPSNNVVDYIYFFTGTELTGVYFKRDALSYTNWPGVRINVTGQLEYRDEDSGTWVTFDSMGGAATNFGDLADVDLSGLAQGDIVYYNGTDWVRLAAGTADQVLATDGAGALSWTNISGTIVDGTAADNTLRWDAVGGNWVQSTALTNDGTDVSASGNITATGNVSATDVAASGNVTVGGTATTTGTLTVGAYTLPNTDGTAGQVLETDGLGALSWTASGAGDITDVGDVSSGAAFNGTQGNTLTFEGTGGAAGDILVTGDTAPVADVTITIPATAGTLVTTGDTGTVATAMIADVNVTTAKIADDNVTEPKLDVMDAPADAEVLSWNAGSSQFERVAGSVSELSDLSDVGTRTATDGNILVADGTDFDSVTMSGDVAIDNAGATTIQTDAVETAMILNSNVTEAKIADSAVTSAKIADATIAAADIADENITESKLDAMDAPAAGEVLAY
ncbi:MAG: hypothetical protein V3S69_03660, partial [Dehalococcoidales bacterium]